MVNYSHFFPQKVKAFRGRLVLGLFTAPNAVRDSFLVWKLIHARRGRKIRCNKATDHYKVLFVVARRKKRCVWLNVSEISIYLTKRSGIWSISRTPDKSAFQTLHLTFMREANGTFKLRSFPPNYCYYTIHSLHCTYIIYTLFRITNWKSESEFFVRFVEQREKSPVRQGDKCPQL